MERTSGDLMPVSAFPGPGGIGGFGQAAYRFVDFLHTCKQHYWQILPLTTTSYGDSPYQSFSARAGNPERIGYHRMTQYLFARQWSALKGYANARGVLIIGDMPIYVSRDSVEMWSEPELFKTAPDGSPASVAGTPPDNFSATGQYWGNPIYDWGAMAADGYSWWKGRMRAALTMYDLVRLDHFRGFEAYWEVPFGSPDPSYGSWTQGPGMAFFDELKRDLGELPLIAEDLGFLTPGAIAMRDGTGFPGLVVGDDPVEELERGGLVVGGSLGVDAPVVLAAGAHALLVLALDADVERDHADLVVAERRDVLVGPGAVLVEDGLAVEELVDGVVAGLRGDLRGVAGGVGEVEVEDLLVLRQVGALDGVGVVLVLVLELVVDRHVGKVGGVAPVGAGVHAGGGEGALDAELGLAGLDVVGDLLERVEVLDVVGGVTGLGQQVLVVDDAVVLLDVVDGVDLAVALELERVVGELAEDLRAGEIEAVVLPVGKAGRAVDLEEGRDGGLGDLGLELLLVGVGGGGPASASRSSDSRRSRGGSSCRCTRT